MEITTEALRSVLNISDEKARGLAEIMNVVLPKYEINTPTRVRYFIAQVAHESWGFTRKAENLNYSAEAIMRTWKTRFKTLAEAIPYARNPEKLANKVYGNRKDLGNTKPGDGWNFRGSGFIQLTGKNNIGAYAKFRGIKDVYEMAKMLREKDEYAMDSACWYVTKFRNILPVMDKGDFIAVTKAINGGTIGLKDRQSYLAKCEKCIGTHTLAHLA